MRKTPKTDNAIHYLAHRTDFVKLCGEIERENIDLREQLLFADQRIKLLELQMQLKTNCKPA